MLYVIYDLDRTSLYCPLAMWLDKYHKLKRLIGNNFFYSLYTPVYILELILGLFKINKAMYQRAKMINNLGQPVTQIVCTARHYTPITKLHKDLVFKDQSPYIDLVCIAAGKTGLVKADILDEIYEFTEDDQFIIYEDNFFEMNRFKTKFKDLVTSYLVLFEGQKESTVKCS